MWIKNCNQIPFTVILNVRKFDNHILSKSQNTFVDEKVEEFSCKGYISNLNYNSICVPLLVVLKKWKVKTDH